MSVLSAFERRAMEIVAMDAYQDAAQEQESTMKGISVRLPEHLILLLDNIAKELRTTRSDVIQNILANGAEEAAQVLSEWFASEADRPAYFMSLHNPLDWGPAPTEGGNE